MSEYTDTIEQNIEFEAFSLYDVYSFLRGITDSENAIYAIQKQGWKTEALEAYLEEIESHVEV